ncbi:MAG: RidA family protein [Magnetospirillum sp. WYHS-4]
MTGTVAARLKDLGIDLPPAPAPAANYVPFVAVGNLLFVSGQLPMVAGEIRYKGRLGADLGIEEGYQAARLCAINLIAQAAAACAGDLDRVRRVVKLAAFVAGTADFFDQPKVVNGASDLLAQVFGEAGRHARFAVGAPSLPLNAAVEIDGVFEIA